MTISQICQDEVWVESKKAKRLCIWLSEGFLIRLIPGLEPEYLRKKCRRVYRNTVRKDRRKASVLPDTGKSWRYARKDGQFYYDYDRIPEARRALLPPAADLVAAAKTAAREDALKAALKPLQSAFNQVLKVAFADYLDYYANYGDEQARLLARTACFLDMLRRQWLAMGQPPRNNTLFRLASPLVDDLKLQYFPREYRRIKDKVVAKGPVVDQVTLPREGNTNALQFGDPSLRALLLMLRADDRNYTDIQITRRIQKSLLLAGQKVPSDSWFARQFAQPETKFYTVNRFAGGRYAAQFESYTPQAGAAYAGDCWMMDGTRVNMIGYSGGVKAVSYAYITVVYDVHSGDLLGWALDVVEDRWTYIAALNMAVNFTGYLPYELVTDRFSGYNTTEWTNIEKRLTASGVRLTKTSVATGKARVERMFGTLQSVFLSESEYYYGEGIKSKRLTAHRSPVWRMKAERQARNEGWDYEASCAEINKRIEAYRTTPLSEYSRRYATVHESPRQLHDGSDKPSVRKVDDWQRVGIFGLETEATVRNIDMLTITVLKNRYQFRIDDYQVCVNHPKVRISYDLDDLTQVYLFEDSDDVNRAYLGTATEERGVHRFGPGADTEENRRAMARAKSKAKLRRQEMDEQLELAQASELDLITEVYAGKAAATTAEDLLMRENANTLSGHAPRLLSEAAEVMAGAYEDEDDRPATKEELAMAARQQYIR